MKRTWRGRKYRYSCGKRQYASEAAALMAFDAIAKVRADRPTFKGNNCHAYLCPHCNRWHLTSQGFDRLLEERR